MKRPALAVLYLAFGLAAGAFGAHGLRPHISPDRLAVFQTGSTYQVYAALSLLVLANYIDEEVGDWRPWWVVFAGSIVFSSSLYALSTTGIKFFGAVTPIGGALMIGSLVTLGISWLTAKTKSAPARVSDRSDCSRRS